VNLFFAVNETPEYPVDELSFWVLVGGGVLIAASLLLSYWRAG
jgi:hypothetical protein